jgi:hypothetical protein
MLAVFGGRRLLGFEAEVFATQQLLYTALGWSSVESRSVNFCECKKALSSLNIFWERKLFEYAKCKTLTCAALRI